MSPAPQERLPGGGDRRLESPSLAWACFQKKKKNCEFPGIEMSQTQAEAGPSPEIDPPIDSADSAGTTQSPYPEHPALAAFLVAATAAGR